MEKEPSRARRDRKIARRISREKRKKDRRLRRPGDKRVRALMEALEVLSSVVSSLISEESDRLDPDGILDLKGVWPGELEYGTWLYARIALKRAREALLSAGSKHCVGSIETRINRTARTDKRGAAIRRALRRAGKPVPPVIWDE